MCPGRIVSGTDRYARHASRMRSKKLWVRGDFMFDEAFVLLALWFLALVYLAPLTDGVSQFLEKIMVRIPRLLRCFVSANIVSQKRTSGGIAGWIASTARMEDCYFHGSITNYDGSYALTGGLAGYIYGHIVNSYSAATISTSSQNDVGGLVGAVYNPGAVTSSYYDSELSGQSDTGKGIPKTTAEMKQQATFQGWNFCTVWEINEGVSYPFFRINSSFSPPTIKTTAIRSARPTVTLNFPQLSVCPVGPGLHFRIEVFADAEMTALIADLNSQDHEFEYRPHDGASWTGILSSGLPATQYANRDTQIRVQMTVGPRQRVYLRASIGEAV